MFICQACNSWCSWWFKYGRNSLHSHRAVGRAMRWLCDCLANHPERLPSWHIWMSHPYKSRIGAVEGSADWLVLTSVVGHSKLFCISDNVQSPSAPLNCRKLPLIYMPCINESECIKKSKEKLKRGQDGAKGAMAINCLSWEAMEGELLRFCATLHNIRWCN